MIQPLEMQRSLPMTLHGGVVSTTTDVWRMLVASRDGDLDGVKTMVAGCPALMTCMYDYTTPLQFAVREGHIGLVHFLVDHKALDPGFRNHPFLEPLLTVAEDREHREIAELLKQSLENPELTRTWTDTGEIDYGKDDVQRRFQDLVDTRKHVEVEALLKDRPGLARDETAFWGEGLLMMPASCGDREMLELLMHHGARVPDVSKWGARYYFKHYDIAAFLMENGMSPNHMNWRRFTLLHDMGFTGDVRKASLLLDHGADINAIDEEYQSTPLGYAAHFGRMEMVRLLLERGAEPNKAGIPASSPLAWARRNGHADIEGLLERAS